MDLADDDLAQDDLDELEQDEALLREIEELQLVNKYHIYSHSPFNKKKTIDFLSSINIWPMRMNTLQKWQLK